MSIRRVTGLAVMVFLSVAASLAAQRTDAKMARGQARILYADSRPKADITNGTYSIKNRAQGGTDGNAYATIQAGVNAMKPGDTLLLREGTYHEMDIYIGDWRSGKPDAWYTVKSLPGEWAVIDGQHNPGNIPANRKHRTHYIIRGTTAGGQQGCIRFENFEITGGGLDVDAPGYPSGGGGIKMRGGPFVFRGLSIHHNYGASNGNNAGVKLESATGETLVEHCHFKGNGEVRTRRHNTSVCNLMIFADYAYGGSIKRLHSGRGYCLTTQRNEVRYCLFEGDAGNGNFTTTGFKHKGMQRLTGYKHADQRKAEDAPPNDNRWEDRGDRIHHNVFVDQMVGIEVDQDYTQVHNNIIFLKNWGNGPANGIQGRDSHCNRRGPFKICVYNNTIAADGMRGIYLCLAPCGWRGDTPYLKTYVFNNIIENGGAFWNAKALTIGSDNVRAAKGYHLKDLPVSRNYFYDCKDPKVVRIHRTAYAKKEIEATVAADKVYVNRKNAGDPLYKTGSGTNRFKTRGAHVLEGATTIASGGLGGSHPYLNGVRVPPYVGATDPADDAWVDQVLNLSNLGKTLKTP